MSNLLYRSSKANQPSVASKKTRLAMHRRVLQMVAVFRIEREQAVRMCNMALLGHVTKKLVYGYHPTKG